MPRRAGDQARRHAVRLAASPWRYLLRNPEFQADVRGLRDFHQFHRRRQDLLKKWSLGWLPSVFHPWTSDAHGKVPELDGSTLRDYDVRLLEQIDPPVWSCTGYEEAFYDAGRVENGEILLIGIDPDAPRDVILAMVEDVVRQAQEQTARMARASRPVGAAAGGRGRGRLLHRPPHRGRPDEPDDRPVGEAGQGAAD